MFKKRDMKEIRSKKIAEANHKLQELSLQNRLLLQENAALKENLTSVKHQIARLEKKNNDYQEKFIALCMAPSNYARYINERSVTDEERSLKKLIDRTKNKDFQGLQELGILSDTIQVVDIPQDDQTG